MKPKVKLIGENGNIFNLMAIASRAIKESREKEKAQEMIEKVTQAKSYDEALRVLMEYVEIE